jgi:glutamyl-Q tRNA(Asp) synthetase
MIITRFAPSPTGQLHLGHAYSALVAHDDARSGGGRYLLRIDDLDSGRVREAYRHGIDEDLDWLGLIPDELPLVQSQRLPAYAEALERLCGERLAYPCFCTRADIAAQVAASVAAPHGPDGPAYPGTCRTLESAAAAERIGLGQAHCWRLDMGAAIAKVGVLAWHDRRRGPVVADPAPFGDIVLARRDAPAAYHLASTVDDAHQGITLVVRGADLFGATHIHRLLQALLGLPTPAYHHHALIAGPDGRRLAKRDDAASIASLRHSGVDSEQLVKALRSGQLPLGYGWLNA